VQKQLISVGPILLHEFLQLLRTLLHLGMFVNVCQMTPVFPDSWQGQT